jgi:hypothetical protein
VRFAVAVALVAAAGCGTLLANDDLSPPADGGADARSMPADGGADAPDPDAESFEAVVGQACALGWQAEYGTAFRTNEVARSGQASCKICPGSGGAAIVMKGFDADAAGYYEVVAWVRSGGATEWGGNVTFLTSASAGAGYFEKADSLSEAWQLVQLGLTPTPDAVIGQLRLGLSSDSGPDACMYVDDVRLFVNGK